MSENNNEKTDSEKREIEALSAYAMKAELYVVPLTFSILALSMQFPVKTSYVYVFLLQSLGWLLLVVSGAAGLKLLRNVSDEYRWKKEEARLANKKIRFLKELPKYMMNGLVGC